MEQAPTDPAKEEQQPVDAQTQEVAQKVQAASMRSLIYFGLVMAGVLILVVVVFGFVLRNRDEEPEPSTDPSTVEEVVTLPEKEFNITFSQGQVSAPSDFSVTQGTRITITIEADVEDEVLLHGYNERELITPGNPVTFSFTADKSGRFELGLVRSGLVLGFLE